MPHIGVVALYWEISPHTGTRAKSLSSGHTASRRSVDPSGGIPVVVNIAIVVAIWADAGIGIIDYELVADVPQGVFRSPPARTDGRAPPAGPTYRSALTSSPLSSTR
jgi:hypothetical protein